MDIYLKSFGARLRSKDGLFEITVPDISGTGKHLVAQHPVHEVESIMLQPGASVSTDALLLAFEGDVNVLILDKFGNPSGRILPNRPSSTLLIWKNQLAISLQKEGLEMAKLWIETKIDERIRFLQKLCAYRSDAQTDLIQQNCTAMQGILIRLRQFFITAHTPDTAATIRGFEGASGKIYYDTLGQLLPAEYQFEHRTPRNPSDLFNAFLNYGYGILYRIVENALIAAGIHPYIGFFHYDGYQNKSMVFDFIEQFRVFVEKNIFHLFSRKLSNWQHLQTSGSKVLLSSDARQLIANTLRQQLDTEKPRWNNKNFAYKSFVRTQAIDLATCLRQYSMLPN
jgi:CRISPR-associated protein Cas1